MSAQILPLSGVHNFRDYGGYALTGGGRLRRRMLYRSGQHFEAHRDDLDRIGRLGLRAVIDLRSDSERRLAPCRRLESFNARVVFVPDDLAQAPHLEAAAKIDGPESATSRMRAIYAVMPFWPYFVKALRAYFLTLIETDGPTLVHCAAGKDRTGIAVALLHDLMGVHCDDLMENYLRTNDPDRIDAHLASGAQSLRATYGSQLSDAAARVLLSVHPAYLEAAFEAIKERHGDVAAYLSHEISLPPDLRERLLLRLAD